MPPLLLRMMGVKRDGPGKCCSPTPEAALQQDAATRKGEMDEAAWEHRAGCRAHTSLAMAKLAAKGSKGKARIQKENPKKLWGVSCPPNTTSGSEEGASLVLSSQPSF